MYIYTYIYIYVYVYIRGAMAGITRKSCVGLFSFHCGWLFKSFEFGKGSRISDKSLVILEFIYLQIKKW